MVSLFRSIVVTLAVVGAVSSWSATAVYADEIDPAPQEMQGGIEPTGIALPTKLGDLDVASRDLLGPDSLPNSDSSFGEELPDLLHNQDSGIPARSFLFGGVGAVLSLPAAGSFFAGGNWATATVLAGTSIGVGVAFIGIGAWIAYRYFHPSKP